MAMRLIGTKLIDDYYRKHAQAKGPLEAWVAEVKSASWRHLNDLKGRFPSADYYDGYVIFNIGGNNHRLVAQVEFKMGVLVVRWIGTHAEYDKKNSKGGFKL
ncbi:type II toxin-antitoxin system HigB family toxin [Enterobacter sichuanensis]|uniref:type II toxin-antitoxin system HigB family toxin n=1 Tax=Enterobacter sichuanensis TaxID=2071710 RepID=UPI002DC025B8|nr:type II toxin-antitoxin system HigB family toxin [Enterobacter sichuanensis]MEB5961077.1 type II toxin-antitoxin system HigB family toxin [Enterobacter sichuanensis]